MTDIHIHQHQSLKKVLVVLLVVFIPVLCFLIIKGSEAGGILLFVIITEIIILVILSRKYYNWIFVFLFLVITAIIFRSQRWPLSGLLFTLGFTGLACSSFYSSILFLRRYKNNKFLRNIGFASSIILSIVALGLLWNNAHWPHAGIFLNTAILFFIPLLFAFIFTLPGSDYITWKNDERIVFFRAIVIPMAFLYTMCLLMFVFPDLWRSLTRLPLLPFGMDEINLLDKPGL